MPGWPANIGAVALGLIVNVVGIHVGRHINSLSLKI
jgi:hypothetical protein